MISKPLLLDLQRNEITLVSPGTVAQLSALVLRSTLFDRILKEQQSDNQLLELKRKSDITGVSEFGLNRDGLLTFRDKICVPIGDEIRKDVLVEAHTTPYSVHPGSTKMFELFAFAERIEYAAVKMVETCTVAQLSALVLRSTLFDRILKEQQSDNQLLELKKKSDLTRVSEFGLNRDGLLTFRVSLVEFTYNNNYQSSIGMAPYEALYGRKCRSPLYWEEVGERIMLGLELVQQTEDVVELIQEGMKTAQSRQKSYADVRQRPSAFEVCDHGFIKIAPLKGVMRFGKKGKLSPRYIGPFEVLDKIGDRAYRLALPPDLD
ncbi:uncharacterized protein [Primulina eburnea]|uniref:uncharacterized protein n=1 Tax=Primulina eburnea TaxID=1245227 RepID=UPI003C6BED00